MHSRPPLIFLEYPFQCFPSGYGPIVWSSDTLWSNSPLTAMGLIVCQNLPVRFESYLKQVFWQRRTYSGEQQTSKKITGWMREQYKLDTLLSMPLTIIVYWNIGIYWLQNMQLALYFQKYCKNSSSFEVIWTITITKLKKVFQFLAWYEAFGLNNY